MSNASVEYLVDIANEHFDDETTIQSQAIVLARAAMLEEGATPEEIREAMLQSRFVGDAKLNLRNTMILFR